MAQTKAKDAQRRRLAKPKPPVRVLKGKKRKPKPVIGPRAGIPVGLAKALKERSARLAKQKELLVELKKKNLLQKKQLRLLKQLEGAKRVLSTPKKKKP